MGIAISFYNSEVHLTSSTQSSFIRDREMQDNILY